MRSYDSDLGKAAEGCFARETGKAVPGDQLKCYRDVLAQYHLHPESRFHNGDYTYRGFTRRRHVRATVTAYIGKEANRWEEQLHLGLDFEAQTEYGLSPEGQGRALDAARRVADTADHFPLRMAFLNSCEGARGSESDAFSSTAARLVSRSVPAVVAIQYEVTDKAAIEFSRDFYEAVADGLPVDAAVAEARTAVSMRSALEWGTPVLYMRSSDGRIFDIQQTVDRPGEIERKFFRFQTLPG